MGGKQEGNIVMLRNNPSQNTTYVACHTGFTYMETRQGQVDGRPGWGGWGWLGMAGMAGDEKGEWFMIKIVDQ